MVNKPLHCLSGVKTPVLNARDWELLLCRFTIANQGKEKVMIASVQHVRRIIGRESKGWVFVPANSRTMWRNSQQITRRTLQTRTETSAESRETYFSVNENDSLTFYSVASFFLTHTLLLAKHNTNQHRPVHARPRVHCQTSACRVNLIWIGLSK